MAHQMTAQAIALRNCGVSALQRWSGGDRARIAAPGFTTAAPGVRQTFGDEYPAEVATIDHHEGERAPVSVRAADLTKVNALGLGEQVADAIGGACGEATFRRAAGMMPGLGGVGIDEPEALAACAAFQRVPVNRDQTGNRAPALLYPRCRRRVGDRQEQDRAGDPERDKRLACATHPPAWRW